MRERTGFIVVFVLMAVLATGAIVVSYPAAVPATPDLISGSETHEVLSLSDEQEAASPSLMEQLQAVPFESASLPPVAQIETAALYSVAVRSQSQFTWPAMGPLTSYFGLGHPAGIDIGLDAGVESPILASAGGSVSFAGGDACCGKGLYVVIDHGGGVSTVYGHLSRILVTHGQRVEQGYLLAYGGATGTASGKHLHFELLHAGKPVDPLNYLPEQQSLIREKHQSAVCPAQAINLDPASSVSLRFVSEGGPAAIITAVRIDSVDGRSQLAGALTAQWQESTITLRVPAAAIASGSVSRFRLTALIGSNDEALQCDLAVSVRATLANAENTAARLRAEAAAAAAAAAAQRQAATGGSAGSSGSGSSGSSAQGSGGAGSATGAAAAVETPPPPTATPRLAPYTPTPVQTREPAGPPVGLTPVSPRGR